MYELRPLKRQPPGGVCLRDLTRSLYAKNVFVVLGMGHGEKKLILVHDP